jgi:diguanylate cyclase (GGDEF)-like protein
VTEQICSGCGCALTHVICPSCGAETLPRDGDSLEDRRASAGDQTISDHDQTTSDRDQTRSDQDQTWSDREQTASDSDQKSSEQDQDAADSELAAGSDRDTYDRTRRARTDATGERDFASRAREVAARERSRSASARDRAAAARDQGAEERDAVSRGRDEAEDPNALRDDILIRAERDRGRAALDRERAADDRIQAAADREIAALERAESLRVRAASALLLRQAATDQLTGARMRFVGLDDAGRELERARRNGGRLTLVFVGANTPDRPGDTTGRVAGDALLKLVGETLRRNLRPYDVIVRYGGNEFVCLLPNVPGAEARARFDRIASHLAAMDAEDSITFGIAEALPTDTLHTLIARANGDLREPKGAGEPL